MATSDKLYILGHPVKHSMSPAMHNAVFQKLGLNWEYSFADCPTAEEARAFLERRAFRALNITTPYKPLALQFASQSSSVAQLAQGANVLVVKSDEQVDRRSNEQANAQIDEQSQTQSSVQAGDLLSEQLDGQTRVQAGSQPSEQLDWQTRVQAGDQPGTHANVQAGSQPSEQLVAYNVDGAGCVSYLKRVGVVFSNARVVVCGTGPTSLSILHAVDSAGVRDVFLVGRNEEHTHEMLAGYEHEQSCLADTTLKGSPLSEAVTQCSQQVPNCASLRCGSYETAARDISAADIIIDATPLGMKPDDPAPFDTALLSADQTVFDVVYGHGESALLAAARQKGCLALDGAGMLVAQAVISDRIFFEAGNIDVALSDNELFDIMQTAAGFNL